MRTFYTKIKPGTKVAIRGVIKGTMGAFCGNVTSLGNDVYKVRCGEAEYKKFADWVKERYPRVCMFDYKM